MIDSTHELVVLARLRPEYAPPGEPPAVHAYRLHPTMPADITGLTAPCGHVLQPGHGERVEQFEGAPCVRCLLFAIGAEDTAIDADEREPTTFAVAEASDTGRYAVGLRGDQVRHLVANNAIRGELDSRSVVLSLCGHLGWGPLETAPTHWLLCGECARIAGIAS